MRLRVVVGSVFIGLALVGGAGSAVAAAPDASAGSFGAFHFGIAVDDAMAAAPDATWLEEGPPPRGHMRSVTAVAGWRLGALDFDVTLQPGYYGAYALVLRHEREVSTAAACFERVAALVVEFEGRFGELEPPPDRQPQRSRGQISIQRTPDGHAFVTASPGGLVGEVAPTVELGSDSEMAVLTVAGDLSGAANWLAYRGPTRKQPWRVRVDARFGRRHELPVCVVNARLDRDGEVPPAVWLDEAQTPLVRQPPIAVLHHSPDAHVQRAAGPLPEAGIRVRP